MYILNDTLVSLSPQNLLDCDLSNFGCDVGEMDTAFMYLRTHGITTEEKYPFTGEAGVCKLSDHVYKATTQEWDEGSEEFLLGIIGE